MIVRNTAALVVNGLGPAATAAHVTTVLELIPTSSRETGDLVNAARGRGGCHKHAVWHLEFEDEGETLDQSGFASVRSLLAAIGGRRERFEQLEQDYEVFVHWGGFSDSGQGGFVIESDVAQQLGALGLPFYGDAYLSDEGDSDVS